MPARMMKATVLLLLVLVAAIALGTSTVAFAEKDGKGPHEGKRHGPYGWLKALNLTSQQKHQVALILKDHRQDSKELMSNLMAARKNLFATVRSQDYNEEAIRKAAREVARYEEEVAVQRARVISEVRKVLTPEQKAKIEAQKADFSGKFERRAQKHMERMDKWIDKHAAQQ